MTVYLTSFRRYHESTVQDRVLGYSIAVYQPHWLPQLPKVGLFDIRDENGQWIRPRDFIGDDERDTLTDPRPPDERLLVRYHDALLGMYRERWNGPSELWANEARLLGLVEDAASEDIALCCWCPYDKAAKRQLEDYGSFVCHSWPVETFLRELGVEVLRDTDRQRMVRMVR